MAFLCGRKLLGRLDGALQHGILVLHVLDEHAVDQKHAGDAVGHGFVVRLALQRLHSGLCIRRVFLRRRISFRRLFSGLLPGLVLGFCLQLFIRRFLLFQSLLQSCFRVLHVLQRLLKQLLACCLFVLGSLFRGSLVRDDLLRRRKTGSGFVDHGILVRRQFRNILAHEGRQIGRQNQRCLRIRHQLVRLGLILQFSRISARLVHGLLVLLHPGVALRVRLRHRHDQIQLLRENVVEGIRVDDVALPGLRPAGVEGLLVPFLQPVGVGPELFRVEAEETVAAFLQPSVQHFPAQDLGIISHRDGVIVVHKLVQVIRLCVKFSIVPQDVCLHLEGVCEVDVPDLLFCRLRRKLCHLLRVGLPAVGIRDDLVACAARLKLGKDSIDRGNIQRSHALGVKELTQGGTVAGHGAPAGKIVDFEEFHRPGEGVPVRDHTAHGILVRDAQDPGRRDGAGLVLDAEGDVLRHRSVADQGHGSLVVHHRRRLPVHRGVREGVISKVVDSGCVGHSENAQNGGSSCFFTIHI